MTIVPTSKKKKRFSTPVYMLLHAIDVIAFISSLISHFCEEMQLVV